MTVDNIIGAEEHVSADSGAFSAGLKTISFLKLKYPITPVDIHSNLCAFRHLREIIAAVAANCLHGNTCFKSNLATETFL